MGKDLYTQEINLKVDLLVYNKDIGPSQRPMDVYRMTYISRVTYGWECLVDFITGCFSSFANSYVVEFLYAQETKQN